MINDFLSVNDDGPEESLAWFCCCGCGWSSEAVENEDDLTFDECPECGNVDVVDEMHWVTK